MPAGHGGPQARRLLDPACSRCLPGWLWWRLSAAGTVPGHVLPGSPRVRVAGKPLTSALAGIGRPSV